MMVKMHNSQTVKILALHSSDGKTLLLAKIQFPGFKYILSKVLKVVKLTKAINLFYWCFHLVWCNTMS